MLAIRRILFPIDFSEQAHAAAPFADAMASRFDARLIVLRVVPVPAFRWWEQTGEPPLIDADQLKHDLEPRLDDAFRREFANLEVERVIEMGEPAEVIARYAETQGMDMIMMPTRGEGPLRRQLIGSVTAKVLHDAQCPVWTRVQIGESQPTQERIRQTVLCAVERTPESTPVMRWAAEFAERMGAALRFVHVIPDVDEWSPSIPELTAIREEARGMIEALQRQAGVRAPSSVVIGKIGPRLCEQAKDHKADLVVIGRGRLHDTPGRLGKNAYDIIRHAPCPVISV